MKVGIVGFGKMGMLHGALLNAMPGVEIVAIADKSRLVLKAFKSILPDIKYFNNHEKMIDTTDLDALVIATPPFNHASIGQYAAERKINLFVEKPLSNSLQDAAALCDAVERQGIKAMVGFCMRYSPSFKKGKEVIDSGKLGKITSVHAANYVGEVLRAEKGWRYNRAYSGGGVLIDFAVHIIDLLYWYFGELATGRAETKQIHSESVEDEVSGELTFKNNVVAEFNSSWSNPRYRKFYKRIEVQGENGSMVATDQTLDVTLHNNGSPVTERFTYADLYEGYHIDIGGSLFSEQMQAFADFLQKDKPPGSDIKSGLHIQQIVDLLYRSAEKNETLSMESGANG